MADTLAFTGILFGWLKTFWFWALVLFGFVIGGYIGLRLRKRRKLIYPCVIITELGADKVGMTTSSSAGWFYTKSTLFGLWDYGNEEVLKTKDGRKIYAGSESDFHEIDGKRGLIVFRKSDDPQILVPLERVKIINKKLVAEIAPADYRDASVEIVRGARAETQSAMEKYAPAIIFGTLIIFALIVIMLIVQFANRQLETASSTCLENARAICNTVSTGVQAVAGSTAP